MTATPGSPVPVPLRVPVSACVVALVGTILTVAVVAWLSRHVDRLAIERFEQLARRQALLLDAAFQRSLATFGSINRLYQASEHVERAEFAAFADAIREENGQFQALEWLPRVGQGEREAYEAAARQDGLTGFCIRERDAHGSMVRAAPRSEYFPIYYTVPLAGNEGSLGFDPSADPECLATLIHARDSGQMAATPPVAAEDERSGGRSFVVFDPVYGRGARPDTVTERRDALLGFAAAVCRIPDMVRGATVGTDSLAVHFILRDLDSPEESGALYVHLSRTPNERRGPADLLAEAKESAGLRHSTVLHVAGRRWSATALPTPQFRAEHSYRDPYIALVSGILATTVVALFVLWSGRKRAELAGKELALRKAQEVARTGSWVLAPRTQSLTCSTEACRILGLPPDRPVTVQELLARVHPDDADRVNAAWAAAVHDRVPFECTHRVPSGSKVGWVASQADLVFDVHGKLCSAVGTVRDVTALREAELALSEHSGKLEEEIRKQTAHLVEAREAAERAHAARSRFLAGMSHEIRNTMNVVLGTTDLLMDGCQDRKQREHLGCILGSGEHLLCLLNDILDLSRMEAGRLELEAEPLQVSEVFAEVRRMVGDHAAAKGLVMDREIAPALRHRLFLGDMPRIAQIMGSCCNSALERTEQGGIVLRSHLLEQGPNEAMLHFEVQDTGPVLGDDQLAAIFDPFSRGDAPSGPGETGLGLAIAKHLARLMGGDAGARRAVSAQGSILWFTARLGTLAARPAMMQPGGSTAVGNGIRDGAKVLIVEDDPISQELAADILLGMGIDAQVVGNGEEALGALGAHDYDAILMDLMMPIMGGLEATRRIRQGGHTVPIIAMTANTYEDDRRDCAEAGMDDFLAKPIDLDLLVAVLARWIPA